MRFKMAAFDYGGVICFPPAPESEAELLALAGVSAAALRELNRKHRGEWDRGECSGAEYYRNILSGCGIFFDNETLKKIAQLDMDCWKRVNPATVQLMRDIKAAGFSLGVLSNMPRDFLPWARGNIPVFGEADCAVFSCEHRLIKPKAAIYETLLRQSRCEASEIVFFDDIPANVEAASRIGMQGVVWKGAQAARELLGLAG